MTTQNQSDPLQNLLHRFDAEQKEFENHPLWRELGTTPKEFFAKIRGAVEASGIDPRVWQTKLAEAKQAVATRVREAKRDYVSFKPIMGLKA